MEFYRKYLLCLNNKYIPKNKWYDCILYKTLEQGKENIKTNLGSTFK